MNVQIYIDLFLLQRGNLVSVTEQSDSMPY